MKEENSPQTSDVDNSQVLTNTQNKHIVKESILFLHVLLLSGFTPVI